MNANKANREEVIPREKEENRQEVNTHFFEKLEEERLLIWFSAGATSAVAAALSLRLSRAGKLPKWVEICYCETGAHHEDNLRFIRDCEQWLHQPIIILRNEAYRDLDDVIEKERYINGPTGAKCTQVLKIAVRKRYQRAESGIQVFGFHSGEVDRAAEYREHFPEVRLKCPLIESGLFHDDCLALLREVGIELPTLYRQGYRNNNCRGCLKGGMGYWNKVRIDDPEIFLKRASQERQIGHSCIKGVFLDELDPSRGNYAAEPAVECEGFCAIAKEEVCL